MSRSSFKSDWRRRGGATSGILQQKGPAKRRALFNGGEGVLGYKVSYQRIPGVLIGKKIHDPKNRSSLFGMAGPIKGEQPASVSLEFITPALPI